MQMPKISMNPLEPHVGATFLQDKPPRVACAVLQPFNVTRNILNTPSLSPQFKDGPHHRTVHPLLYQAFAAALGHREEVSRVDPLFRHEFQIEVADHCRKQLRHFEECQLLAWTLVVPSAKLPQVSYRFGRSASTPIDAQVSSSFPSVHSGRATFPAPTDRHPHPILQGRDAKSRREH